MFFDYPPTVDVLASLVKEPLYKSGNLSKAIRIWGILRTLYGKPTDPWRLNLKPKEDWLTLDLKSKNLFKYTDWHKAFYSKYSKYHPNIDKIPDWHHQDCICAKTIKDLLFNDDSSEVKLEEKKWRENFKMKYKEAKIDNKKIDSLFEPKKRVGFLNKGKYKKQLIEENPHISQNDFNSLFKNICQLCPDDLIKITSKSQEEIYEKYRFIDKEIINSVLKFFRDNRYESDTNRPFGCTRKSLNNIFKDELSQGDDKWIIKKREIYYFLANSPKLNLKTQKPKTSEDLESFREDLADIVRLTEPINGIFRVYFNLEYVNTDEQQDKVADLLEELTNNIWKNEPVPWLKMIYNSAILSKQITRIIYPICSYYNRRATYLCTYGQGFEDKQSLEYRNYRLDRIETIEIIEYNDRKIPNNLKPEKFNHRDYEYSSEYIQEELEKALGFNFYLPIATMLISFPQKFNQEYVQDTFRHQTFEKLGANCDFVKNEKGCFTKLVNTLNLVNRNKEQNLLKEKFKLFPNDVCYKLNYRTQRQGSLLACNDVLMRLRQWANNGTVLFPEELREQRNQEALEIFQNHQ
jgi:CRISPR-associated protein (TIGR03985 family)